MCARKGVALILVLGTLVVLAALAAAFATLAGTERQTARNYLDGTRARLLARSGIEDAVARLRETSARTGLLDDATWPYADPLKPSFALGTPIALERGPLGVSGVMAAGAYARNGDVYTLRVVDANAMINVNDGVAWGPDHAVTRNLRRLLNVLGAQPSVALPGLGDRIVAGRPSTGYASKLDVARALSFDPKAWRRVRDFITAAAWTDPGVAHPVPLSAEEAGRYPAEYVRPGGRFRHGHQKNARGDAVRAPLRFFDAAARDPAHNAIWGRDSLNPGSIEIVARSPVNVNAARKEVLTALLTDLEGFFLVERRREAPGGYAWADLRYTYDASGAEGDECGFLYRTVPLVGPGGRHTDGIPAEHVADEIIACRSRRPSPRVAGLDYATAPFGGPFRSWSQFNGFADALVRGGLLVDRREGIYWDYDASGRPRTGSAIQLRIASQAVGDVLKANFNPNLHLNEINPNRTLFSHVDKTDLITHSTEFSFTPMGVFEIESTGRVLRPQEGDDAFAAPANDVVAMCGLTAVVRIFDAVRETSQRDFYAGEASERKGAIETNNNLALETGPEADNGPAPAANGYEGYVQLSTTGGNFFSPGLRKPRDEVWTTMADPKIYPGATTMGAPTWGQFGSVIHAHYQLDHAAHHHANRSAFASPPWFDGFRLPQGAWTTVSGRRCCINRNWEDRTEALPGPYGPVDDTRTAAGRFRIARSFDLREGEPPAAAAAPSDLRVDGAYVERDSAFGYWIEENVSFNFNQGAVAFWLKPGFFPEMTGKSRTLLSFSRYHAHQPDRINLSPFALFHIPGAGPPADGAPPCYPGATGRLRPGALAFGFGFSTETGYNWEMTGQGGPGGDPPEKHATDHAFAFSPVLNHEGHGPDDGDPRRGDDGGFNYLRAHEWTHVAVTWNNPLDRLPTADTVRIYVNGRLLPDSAGMPHLYDGTEEQGQPFAKTPRWAVHSLQAALPGLATPKWCVNSVRIGGEPSTLFDGTLDRAFPRNFSADSTFDEFYLWLDRSRGLSGLRSTWARGRYYRPDDADPSDALFTSRPLTFRAPIERALPPASAIVDPAGAGPRPAVVSLEPRPRIIGLSWTELAEKQDGRGAVMFDYATTTPAELRTGTGNSVDFWAGVAGTWYGPLRDPGFSTVRAPAGEAPEFAPGADVRYRAKLKAGGPRGPDAALLSTPVLDDVTVFYESGRPEILGWSVMEVNEP